MCTQGYYNVNCICSAFIYSLDKKGNVSIGHDSILRKKNLNSKNKEHKVIQENYTVKRKTQ